MFVLALAVSATVQTVLGCPDKLAHWLAHWLADWLKVPAQAKKDVLLWVEGSALELLIVGAFFFLALSVLAYEEAAGWLAVGISSAVAVAVLVSMVVDWM